MQHLGRRLRQLRQRAGLTQLELAKPRYTHAYVSTIESGRRNPSPEAIAFFAKRLGVSVEELTTGRPPDLRPGLQARLLEAKKQLFSGDVDGAGSAFAGLEREAARFALHQERALAIEGRARCSERRDDVETAIELFEAAAELHRTVSPVSGVDATCGLARCVQSAGDIRYAIHLLESLKGSLERQGLTDPSAMLRIHASLVAAYFESGLLRQAYESAETALQLVPKVEDLERVANMHLNVSWVLLHQGRPDDAQVSIHRATDLFHQLGLRTELARALLLRGIMFSRQNKTREARADITGALDTFTNAGDRINQVRASNELARLERCVGRIDHAVELLRTSIDLLKDADHPGLEGWALREMAACLIERDPREAEKRLRGAVERYSRTEEAVELAATYRMLGDLLTDQDDQGGAVEAYRAGILALEERL